VAADRWADFIEFARRMRAKPTFDLEERDYRLRLAAAVRQTIDAAHDGRDLRDRVNALARCHLSGLDTVLPPRQLALLADWAERDEAGLGRVLTEFSDGRKEPEAQIERFVQAVAADPGAERFLAGGLAIASLLGFGTSPETRPIMSGHLHRLEQLLGEDGALVPDLRAQYRRNLAFVHRLEHALEAAGVPVRDMVDVESLIMLGSLWHELWAGRGETATSRRTAEPEVYLAACMQYRNEARYLAEWIEFHLLVGVERFYLYDNESDDNHLEVLAPYIEEGIVVLHEWPGTASTQAEVCALQVLAFDHCIKTHGHEARWITFNDADEFLFSPTGRPVSEILVDYERWPGVVANWAPFGTSGHVTRPSGLVIENYTSRFDGDPAALLRMGLPRRADQMFKTILDPTVAIRCVNLHAWEYAEGTAVDENGYPVSSKWIFTKSTSAERLRVNHYFARSEEDVRAKHAIRVRAGEPLPPSDELQRMDAGMPDETILSYSAPLRDALRRRGSHVPS
jgi:glycosyl transferase family 92